MIILKVSVFLFIDEHNFAPSCYLTPKAAPSRGGGETESRGEHNYDAKCGRRGVINRAP